MKNYTIWSDEPPPYGVPLVIYCYVKGYRYSHPFTREEIEAWASRENFPDDPVRWYRIGWALTGIAKEGGKND